MEPGEEEVLADTEESATADISLKVARDPARDAEFEEEEQKKREAERDKISIVETVFLLLVAILADAFEIVAGLTIFLAIVGLLVGFLASGIILLWGVLRSGAGYLIFRRLIITIGGWFFDAATLGILPIRTVALVVTIWVNNRDANKRIKEADAKLEEFARSA